MLGGPAGFIRMGQAWGGAAALLVASNAARVGREAGLATGGIVPASGTLGVNTSSGSVHAVQVLLAHHQLACMGGGACM